MVQETAMARTAKMDITVDISLQPKQALALQTVERGQYQYLFYGGAKLGGKSHLIRAKEVYRRLKYPGTTGVIIRRTFPELLSNHIRRFWRDYPYTKQWYKASEKAIYYPNGSITEFKHLQNTSDVYDYQGIEYDDITVDEATQHEEEIFKILKTSLRSDPATIANNPGFKNSFLLTGNPGGRGHSWVKRIFVDKKFNPDETALDYHFIQAKIYDNPIAMKANPQYLKNLQDLPGDIRRAYLDGDWDIFIGQFFSDFRRDIHVIEPIKIENEWGKWFSVDWGYSPHPYHIGFYAKDFEGNIFKYRELSGIETPPADLAQRFLDVSKEDVGLKLGVGDTQMWAQNPFQQPKKGEAPTDKSIAAQFNAVIGKENKFMYQANKERITGWAELRSLMKWDAELNADGTRCFTRKPKFYIFSTCPETIGAYPDQIHSELRPEDMLKQDGDDPCDTDRYAVMGIKGGILPKETKTREREMWDKIKKPAHKSGFMDS